MNGLTVAVLATITSHREMSERALEIARNSPRLPGEYAFRHAEWMGNAICIEIGESLSRRFDGAVPADGIHDMLWMTFMGMVDWSEVGRYYLEDAE